VRERTSELEDATHRLQIAEQDRRFAQEETIHRLALAAEFRDDGTSRHIERMSRYCAILAELAGIREAESELAAIADVFDALTSDQVYRKAFPLPEALAAK
jgi:HD-GYP domain-containing protein (c-di-GMP phosphodiesterase class II)